MTARFVDIGGRLLNVDEIKSAEVSNQFYMNGSLTFLVIVMRDGERISREHGWGFDAYAALDKIRSSS